MFGFSGEGDDDVNIVEGLHKRINLLQQVQGNEDGYKLVIPMTEDSSLGLSSHDQFIVRNKSQVLIVLLSHFYFGIVLPD